MYMCLCVWFVFLNHIIISKSQKLCICINYCNYNLKEWYCIWQPGCEYVHHKCVCIFFTHQINSRQCEQKVGWRKNVAINLCPLTCQSEIESKKKFNRLLIKRFENLRRLPDAHDGASRRDVDWIRRVLWTPYWRPPFARPRHQPWLDL